MSARKTPFYDVGVAAGANMQEIFGYWLPWEYAPGHVEEHVATRSRVTAVDLDYMAEFEITGPDSLAFLQHLCTNDFGNLSVGSVRYTTMCTDDGYMVDDGTVWRFGDNWFVFITGEEADYDWISQQAASFEVTVSNKTAEWTTLAIQGPKSRDALQSLTEEDLSALRYYRFVQTRVGGVQCTVARLGYTGEYGFELHFDPQDGEAVWGAVMSSGSSQGILPCGQAALESLRQEAGYLLVGNDHDSETNPIEAGLGGTVKFEKNEFNGRSALAKLLETGVSRQLVWLRLVGQDEVASGARVETPEGNAIGAVTSSSYSPTQDHAVAMAYLNNGWAVQSMQARIQDNGASRTASVSVAPLYDPGNVRTRFAPQ